MNDKFIENILGQICTELFSFQEKFEYLAYYIRANTKAQEGCEDHKEFAGSWADDGSADALALLYKIGLVIGNDVMLSKNNTGEEKNNA